MNIGDKISFELFGYELTSTWNNPYGITYLYTFKDKFSNIYIWKTSIYLDKKIKYITARIKEFVEYNNQKEIVLKYCKFK